MQRARIVRNLNESQLARALRGLLEPNQERRALPAAGGAAGSTSRRLPDLGRAVRTARRDGDEPPEPLPPDEPMIPASPGDGAAS